MKSKGYRGNGINVPSGKSCQCGRCRPCRRRAEREAKKPAPKQNVPGTLVAYYPDGTFVTSSSNQPPEPKTKPVFHA